MHKNGRSFIWTNVPLNIPHLARALQSAVSMTQAVNLATCFRRPIDDSLATLTLSTSLILPLPFCTLGNQAAAQKTRSKAVRRAVAAYHTNAMPELNMPFQPLQRTFGSLEFLPARQKHYDILQNLAVPTMPTANQVIWTCILGFFKGIWPYTWDAVAVSRG